MIGDGFWPLTSELVHETTRRLLAMANLYLSGNCVFVDVVCVLTVACSCVWRGEQQ